MVTLRRDSAKTSPIMSAPASAVAMAVGTSLSPQIFTSAGGFVSVRPCSSRILAAGSAARMSDSPTNTPLTPAFSKCTTSSLHIPQIVQ